MLGGGFADPLQLDDDIVAWHDEGVTAMGEFGISPRLVEGSRGMGS